MSKPTESPFNPAKTVAMEMLFNDKAPARTDLANSSPLSLSVFPALPRHTEWFSFVYHNHNGITETRRVRKEGAVLAFLANPGYNYGPGFFLVGHCLDRDAIRSFALANMIGEIQPNRDSVLVSL